MTIKLFKWRLEIWWKVKRWPPPPVKPVPPLNDDLSFWHEDYNRMIVPRKAGPND